MEDKERWIVYDKLPKTILEIMEWLCDTRFYKKTYNERKEYYEDIKEKWKFCDFNVILGTYEKPMIIEIGELPHYQYDTKKALVIDLTNNEHCWLERGYAVASYASKVLINKYEIPKYMKEDLYNFIDKVNDELKEGKKNDK